MTTSSSITGWFQKPTKNYAFAMFAVSVGVVLFFVAADKKKEKVITAERFVLVNEDGKAIAVWGISPDGPNFQLGDEKENARIRMMAFKDRTEFSVLDADGRGHIELNADAEKRLVRFVDTKGRHRQEIRQSADYTGHIIRDNNGVLRAHLVLDGENVDAGFLNSDGKGQFRVTVGKKEATIKLAKRSGQGGFAIGAYPDATVLALGDEDNKARIVIRLIEGTPIISVLDKDEKERISVKYAQDKPSVTLMDENGKVISELPK